MNTRRRWILAIAAASVLVAAMDTYVIVLALPAIMADVGIGVDQLQAATPIVSGFLLGYIVVMPLLGRLSDVYGRRPLLLLCLAVFAAGSLVTASATDLGSVVAGRALQGLGGGGLVPVTLALVADLWPPERRGLPLGVIGGVQELGSVLGPLYGGLILTRGDLADDLLAEPPDRGALALGLVVAGRRGGSRRSGGAAPAAAIASRRARRGRDRGRVPGDRSARAAPRQRHDRRCVQRARRHGVADADRAGRRGRRPGVDPVGGARPPVHAGSDRRSGAFRALLRRSTGPGQPSWASRSRRSSSSFSAEDPSDGCHLSRRDLAAADSARWRRRRSWSGNGARATR